MHNFLVLGISLAIITGPIAFVAFLAGYNYAKRVKMTVHNVSIDEPDEYRTVIHRHNKRTII